MISKHRASARNTVGLATRQPKNREKVIESLLNKPLNSKQLTSKRSHSNIGGGNQSSRTGARILITVEQMNKKKPDSNQ